MKATSSTSPPSSTGADGVGVGGPAEKPPSTATTTNNACNNSGTTTMGKTRKRRKFFKFLSCLSKKSEELEETIASSSPVPSSAASPLREEEAGAEGTGPGPVTKDSQGHSQAPSNHKNSSSSHKDSTSPNNKSSGNSAPTHSSSRDGITTTPVTSSGVTSSSSPCQPAASLGHGGSLTIESESGARVEGKPDGRHGDGNQDNEVEEEFVEVPPPMEELKSHTSQPAQSKDENPSDSSQQAVLTQQIETIVKQRLGSDRESCQATDTSSATTSNSTSDLPQIHTQTSTESSQNKMAAVSTPTEEAKPDEVDGASAPETPQPPVQEQDAIREKYKRKRAYVITELVETERDYVKDLGQIVEGYMKMIQNNDKAMPEGMEGKDKIVFGNIHQIFDWHRDTFSQEVEKCGEDPSRIGPLFTRFEKKLDYMYVKYCENKPKSEYIVAEYIEFFEELRKELGHKLQLPDLLIKPVQRITKYKLLLTDILKHTDHMGDDTKELQRAVQVMSVVPKAANDMMNVGRLQGFDGKITAQGNLLLQETLMVMEMMSKSAKSDQQKFKERRVFLFDQIIIFSEEIEKKKNNLSNPGYIYKHSLMVNKMELEEKGNGDLLTFSVIDKSPRSDLKLICQAPSEQVKQNWVSQIKSILKMQRDFLTALTNPTKYNTLGSKDPAK